MLGVNLTALGFFFHLLLCIPGSLAQAPPVPVCRAQLTPQEEENEGAESKTLSHVEAGLQGSSPCFCWGWSGVSVERTQALATQRWGQIPAWPQSESHPRPVVEPMSNTEPPNPCSRGGAGGVQGCDTDLQEEGRRPPLLTQDSFPTSCPLLFPNRDHGSPS